MGTGDDTEAGAGVNGAAEEGLKYLLGVSVQNVKYVMGKVGSLREFCKWDVKGAHDILGVHLRMGDGEQGWGVGRGLTGGYEAGNCCLKVLAGITVNCNIALVINPAHEVNHKHDFVSPSGVVTRTGSGHWVHDTLT